MDREEVIEWIEFGLNKEIKKLEQEKEANPDNDPLWYKNNTALRHYRTAINYIKENLK